MDEIESKNMKFEFVLSKWMSPSAHVIVYYIQNFGEVVYDRLKIETVFSTSNKVKHFHKNMNIMQDLKIKSLLHLFS